MALSWNILQYGFLIGGPAWDQKLGKYLKKYRNSLIHFMSLVLKPMSHILINAYLAYRNLEWSLKVCLCIRAKRNIWKPIYLGICLIENIVYCCRKWFYGSSSIQIIIFLVYWVYNNECTVFFHQWFFGVNIINCGKIVFKKIKKNKHIFLFISMILLCCFLWLKRGKIYKIH